MKFSEPIYKRVSKEEFEDFIKNYPVDLKSRTDTAFIPIRLEYYDNDLENPQVSYVAATYDYKQIKVPEEEQIYIILDNLDDLYIELEEQYDAFEDKNIRQFKKECERLSRKTEENEKKFKQEVDKE